MNRFRVVRSGAISGAVMAILIAAVAIFGNAARTTAPPLAGPSASPPLPPGNPGLPSPTSNPSVRPIDQPENSDDASDGVDSVVLANWPGVDSSVVVWDESESLADAVSGSPDREPVAAKVVETAVSADGSIVRLTWSDLPIASRAMLSIRKDHGKYRINLVRPHSQGPTDNVVSERVLELHFNVAVPVDDIDVHLVESLSPSAGIGLVEAGLSDSDGTGLLVAVWDETDGLRTASIERVAGTPSVGPDAVRVANDDPKTLRVTWADPKVFTSARLSIRVAEDGRYKLRLARERPQGPTEPAALERVIVLPFNVAVPAADIDVEVIDSMANPS